MRKLKLLLTALAIMGGVDSVKAQTDVTATYIANPSFEENGSSLLNVASTAPTGWSVTGDKDKNKLHNSSSDTDNDFGPTSTAAGDYYYYMRRAWAGGSAKLSQTISSLPAGYYTFSAKVKTMHANTANSSYYLSANGVKTSSTTFTTGSINGFGSLAWTTVSVSFLLEEAKDNIEIALNVNWVSGGSQIAIDDVHLTVDYSATSADYDALDAAILAAETKVIGFEAGEYAPYNNIAATTALSAAKTIDRSVSQSQSIVQGYTAALAPENWTVNAARVNAFYRGNFAEYTPGDISGNNRAVAIGWSNQETANCGVVGLVNNEPAQGGDNNPGLAGLTSQKGLYLRGGFSTAYGSNAGYNVPLKANAIYTLSFTYGGWGQFMNNAGTVTVKDGSAITVLSTKVNTTGTANSSTTAWQSFNEQVLTNSAGNYTIDLNFVAGGQSAFSDFSLLFDSYQVKAFATELPVGNMTADTWYYFDIATAGDYKLTAINLDNIIYVTDGTLSETTAGTAFDVDANNVQNLAVGRYYVKSTSEQSLTVAVFNLADAADYAALNAAISAAENNFGFEDGEYAPYNNINMLPTLAEAKTINQDADNPQATVQGYTAALAPANWTPNVGEVNAIRWEKDDYADNTDSQVPLGFTNGDGNAIRISANYGNNVGLNQLAQPICLNINTNDKAAIYGETTGYTLPLKGNTVYKLTFGYAGWGNSSGTPVIIITDGNGTQLKNVSLATTAVQGHNTTSAWTSAAVLFKTTDAGNYKVSFGKSGNRTAFGDLSLLKSAGTETVTVSNVGFATYVSDNDLDYSAVEGLKVYKATVSDDVITFTKVTTVPAGEGVLLQNEGEFTVPVTNNLEAWADNDNAFVRGTGAAVATQNGSFYNYILNEINGVVGFYQANNQTVAVNRAYLQATTNAARIALNFFDEDGQTTSITEKATAIGEKAKDVYDLQGRKVNSSLNKGLYIVNGKKIVIK